MLLRCKMIHLFHIQTMTHQPIWWWKIPSMVVFSTLFKWHSSWSWSYWEFTLHFLYQCNLFQQRTCLKSLFDSFLAQIVHLGSKHLFFAATLDILLSWQQYGVISHQRLFRCKKETRDIKKSPHSFKLKWPPESAEAVLELIFYNPFFLCRPSLLSLHQLSAQMCIKGWWEY